MWYRKGTSEGSLLNRQEDRHQYYSTDENNNTHIISNSSNHHPCYTDHHFKCNILHSHSDIWKGIILKWGTNHPSFCLPCPSNCDTSPPPLLPPLSWSLPPSPDEGVWDPFIRLLPPSSRSVSVPLERLRSGISYEFRVLAVNRYGYGQPSAPSAALAGKHAHIHTPVEIRSTTGDPTCVIRIWLNF